MSDPNLFARPNLEILLGLVRVRRTYVLEHTQAPPPVRDALRDLENQLVALLAAPELPEPRPPAREPLIVQVPTLLSLVDDQLPQHPERDLVFATPVEGQQDSWIVDLVCGHKKAVRERKASYVCRECPKEST